MTVQKLLERFAKGSRKALKNRRTVLLLIVTAFMGLDAATSEALEHHYVSAGLTLLFFFVIAPWFGWNYIKPPNNEH